MQAYWPLVLVLVLVAGFASWVFIHSNRSYLLRWAVIPASLVAATVSAHLYDARLGYAVAADLPAKFLYLGHQVIVADNHKAGIEVWASTGGTRLYRIPYSKPVEDAMDHAREQAKDGVPVLMHKVTAGARGSSPATQRVDTYESNVVLPSGVAPKKSG